MNNSKNCPICNTPEPSILARNGDGETLECRRCGKFGISKTDLVSIDELDIDDKSMLSHWIRRRNDDSRNENPKICSSMIDKRINSKNDGNKIYHEIFDKEITLNEKLDSFIFQVGKNSKYFGSDICGDNFTIFLDKVKAYCGCNTEHDGSEIGRMIESLKEDKFLSDKASSSKVRLTSSGWKKYEEMKKSVKQNNRVFMAMQFDDKNNNNSYKAKGCLSNILKSYDLKLFSMEHHKELGNMIDTMKAEINRAKFIICDLTHGNKGAYWESGYAEGQNKKVIYICDKKVFDENLRLSEENEKQKEIHFDIKQSRIISFDLSDENKNTFEQEIKDTVEANNLDI